MNDINKIIHEIVLQLEVLLEAQKKSVAQTITASLEAPSRMEARYDSRKEEMARLAEAQDEIVLEMEQSIKDLKQNKNKLIPADSGFYLVVSKNGGKSFNTSIGKVTLVSIQSPFGSKLLASQGEALRI